MVTRSLPVRVALVGAFALLSVIALPSSALADDVPAYTTTTNVAPTGTVAVDTDDVGTAHNSSITLNEGPTVNTSISVLGTVTDANGCNTLATSTTGLVLFATTNTVQVIGEMGSQTAMTDYCLTLGSDGCFAATSTAITWSGCDSVSDTTVDFSATFAARYYLQSSASTNTWHGVLSLQDNQGEEVVGSISADVTVVASAALDLNSAASVEFGELALGADSSEQSLTIRNTGNTAIDYRVYGGTFTCSLLGSFAASSQVARHTVSGFAFDGMTAIGSSNAVSAAGVSVPRNTLATDSTPRSTTAYLRLRLPSSGVAGVCTGTLSIDAV